MKIHEAFPYLRVRGASEALAYYRDVFGVEEKLRLVEPSGRIGHAELDFGAVTVMVAEEYPEHGITGPASLGGTLVGLHLHVDDCDAVIARMVEKGGKVIRPAADHFYGERSGTVRDPFGHEWLVGHSIEEEVTGEEMQRRYTELMTGG